MRMKLFLCGILASLIATPAMARASTQENIGIGVGSVIGAVAGGPVGFIVGAAFGAKIGDEFHQKDRDATALSDSLADSKETISDLEASIDSLGGDLQRMQAVARPELLALMQAGIEMDLLFRTDEDKLGIATDSKLRQLATALASMPDVLIQLDGFADERGNAEYNQNLSARRAEHVREILTSNGVAESRIKLAAHGESPAADDNIDSFALERKVSLTLFIDESPSFASNPE